MSDRATPAIQSPCIQLCVLEPDSGYCMGCGRTGDEIASWISLVTGSGTRGGDFGQLGHQRLENLTRSKRRKGGRRTRLADAG